MGGEDRAVITAQCPHCGATLTLANGRLLHLSPAALRLIEAAPERFRRGTPMPAHAIGAAIGYSETSTRRALQELTACGVVFAIAYGKRTVRHRYAGVPAQMLNHRTTSTN